MQEACPENKGDVRAIHQVTLTADQHSLIKNKLFWIKLPFPVGMKIASQKYELFKAWKSFGDELVRDAIRYPNAVPGFRLGPVLEAAQFVCRLVDATGQ
jgi:hypothetical protein